MEVSERADADNAWFGELTDWLRQREWRLLRFGLLAHEPKLFSEVDRLEAEGEFRFAVGASVLVLGAVLFFRGLYDPLLGGAVLSLGLALVLAKRAR